MNLWPAIAVFFQIAVLVTARHLSYDDDLQADSLVLVNKTRRDISVEGSGDDDVREIKPMPRGLVTMERMEAPSFAESLEEKFDKFEGSGEAETPKTEPILESIDEVFNAEEGMKEVLESIKNQDDLHLPTNDQNRHDNTLSVIAGQENSPINSEESETLLLEDDEEGSGEVLYKNPEAEEIVLHEHKPTGEVENLQSAVNPSGDHESEETNKPGPEISQSVVPTSEDHESEETKKSEPEILQSVVPTSEDHEIEETNKSDPEIFESVVTTTEDVQSEEINKSGPEVLQSVVPTSEDNNSEDTNKSEPEILPNAATTTEEPEIPVIAESEPENFQNIVTTTENPEIQTPQPEDDGSSEQPIKSPIEPVVEEESTESVITEETSTQPDQLENETKQELSTDLLIETSSAAPSIMTEIQTTTSSSEPLIESTPETPKLNLNELETTTIESQAEEINGTVLIPAVLGESIAETPAPQLEPKTSSIGWYYVIGLLAVCLVILIAVVALRNRKRGHKLRNIEIGQDRDTEKSLLSNGRFKEDSEDNNVKNNEIAPLVIKQNSQINKFEKSPNFSSPKNLNVQAQDKNIEKDNVLKSTQAIIEDEVDDAKKEVEEEIKKTIDESSPLTAEKVVVRTHVDLDSIPRKPIVINRNGHSYLAVPGGETKT